jgi:hypothetical protein
MVEITRIGHIQRITVYRCDTELWQAGRIRHNGYKKQGQYTQKAYEETFFGG